MSKILKILALGSFLWASSSSIAFSEILVNLHPKPIIAQFSPVYGEWKLQHSVNGLV